MFKSILTLATAALIATGLAAPAQAVLAHNALSANGTRAIGVELRIEQPRLLMIELPRE